MPIYAIEEGMSLDFAGAAVAQPLYRVPMQQLFKQVDTLVGELVFLLVYKEILTQNVLEQLIFAV